VSSDDDMDDTYSDEESEDDGPNEYICVDKIDREDIHSSLNDLRCEEVVHDFNYKIIKH
jgi:hypothetical protein